MSPIEYRNQTLLAA
ncbi:MAG: hypothetical protein HWE24_06490 [Oceanospirillaceae bacterium]|nr:hypothetical protein [Oceanospirillaceae bacterium]